MRIRSIKPEFWRSPDISSLEIEDRLLFIGLWSYVDDNGVGQDRVSLVAADLFADDLSRDPRETLARVTEGLGRLAEAGRIVRYSVDGRDFMAIDNWKKHQRIDKPNKPRYPAPTSDNVTIRETLAKPSRDPRDIPAPGTGEQGNRGTGEQSLKDLSDSGESDDQAPEPAPASKPKKTRHQYSPEFEEFWKLWPNARGASKFETSKKFTTALKAADVETILAGARRFASDPNMEPEFCPMPTTWLHNRRWGAGPLPSRGQPQGQQSKATTHRFGTRPEDWGPQAPPATAHVDYRAGATVIDEEVPF